jgi:hypothetical protein
LDEIEAAKEKELTRVRRYHPSYYNRFLVLKDVYQVRDLRGEVFAAGESYGALQAPGAVDKLGDRPPHRCFNFATNSPHPPPLLLLRNHRDLPI